MRVTNTHYKFHIPKYSRRSGPIRVLGASITPLGCFKLFYTEHIFWDLVDYANENAKRRKESDPDNNKGDWKMLTVDELKAYYGLVIMKDIITLDRDAHCWHQGGKHFLPYIRFGNVMSRNSLLNPFIPLLCWPNDSLSMLPTNCTKFDTFWTMCVGTFRMSMCHSG